MYCQTCGAEIQAELNYCNRCGAVINSPQSAAALRPETAPVNIQGPVRTLGATIVLTTLLGFTILFFAVGGLASAVRPLPPELLGVLSVAGLLIILIIDVMLIRILSRLVQLPTAPALQIQTSSKRPETRELHAAPAQSYIQATTDPLPIASVTDHTTRTFHPVYQEPRAKS
jgi:hypothetical protein